VVGIVSIDQSGTVRSFSRGAEHLLGRAAEDVVGHSVTALMPQDSHESFAQYLKMARESGEAEIIGSGRHLEGVRPDGARYSVELRVDSMTIVDGETIFAGVLIDQGESGASRYWLDEFFDLTLDLLAVATFDGTFIRLNPAWHATLGYPLAELMAQPYLSFVHPEDQASTRAVMSELTRGEPLTHFENRYRAADGSYRMLEWTAKPLLDRGIVMAAAHDVTRRHNVEVQLRATRDRADEASHYKSEFLSRMSHELRTPLNSIIGFSQLLQMDDLTEEQVENLDAIQRSSRHLLNMINEVLDLAKIEAGKLRLSLEPVEVAAEIDAALDLIGPQAAERGLSVEMSAEHDGVCVLADRQRLLQILLNLFSNAVKYNRANGSISVDVQASGGTVTIAVTDTGDGIDQSKLAALFRPFERLGAEATAVEGTGVGLALSKTLSREMNGTLTVFSTPGTGSTFCLELPQAQKPPMDLEPQPDRVAVPDDAADAVRPITVLYIEDNITNSQLIDRALQTQKNVDLAIAVQGSLGLDLVNRLHPDLVLLDLHLPDMTGEDVLRSIRATPEVADTTVVICSADASRGRPRKLIEAGANGYLTKPIELADLFEIVRRVRRREPLDQLPSEAT
jgi:PAS domain S-box-containing protein